MNAIRPIAETAETVTLSREDYESLREAAEDAADITAARIAEARIAAGETEVIPIDMVERLASGDHPVRVWREYRGMTGSKLAEAAGLPQSYISEIETGKKPGSLDAMVKLARALRVDVDDLIIE